MAIICRLPDISGSLFQVVRHILNLKISGLESSMTFDEMSRSDAFDSDSDVHLDFENH